MKRIYDNTLNAKGLEANAQSPKRQPRGINVGVWRISRKKGGKIKPSKLLKKKKKDLKPDDETTTTTTRTSGCVRIRYY